MGAPGKPNPVSRENGKKGGRPKATATLIGQMFREELAKEIKKDMQEWIDPMRDLIKGVKVLDEKSGEVYKRPPDPNAWQKVMDRAFGKPKETVEVQDTASEEAMEKIDATRADVQELAKRFDDELKQKLMK